VGDDRLRACDWFVDGLPMSAGAELVREHHYSRSCANTSVACHGLYHREDYMTPKGAALWMPPTPNAAKTVAPVRRIPLRPDWRAVLCLSRLVVLPEVPTNGASFLLGRSMQLLDRDRWPVLLTFADSRHGHSGAIYKATNWTDLGEVKAGDQWIGPFGEQRGCKRGPRNLSVAELEAMGFTRLPAAPKRKFVHSVAALEEGN
jgi:hypothetical protein